MAGNSPVTVTATLIRAARLPPPASAPSPWRWPSP